MAITPPRWPRKRTRSDQLSCFLAAILYSCLKIFKDPDQAAAFGIKGAVIEVANYVDSPTFVDPLAPGHCKSLAGEIVQTGCRPDQLVSLFSKTGAYCQKIM